MTIKDIRKDVDRMMEEVEGFSCETCPYAAECHRNELWWGCGQWEDEMGEDL